MRGDWRRLAGPIMSGNWLRAVCRPQRPLSLAAILNAAVAGATQPGGVSAVSQRGDNATLPPPRPSPSPAPAPAIKQPPQPDTCAAAEI